MIGLPELDEKVSRYFTFRDFCEAGGTFAYVRPENVPEQRDTYLAIQRLCSDVLDPVAGFFGRPEITYGFSGPNLYRQIKKRIDPSRDQHSGHEQDGRGRVICKRLGQAADFLVKGVSSKALADWIVRNTGFDRLYFYGVDLPLHVSVGPEASRVIVRMIEGATSRRIPRLLAAELFLDLYLEPAQ